MILGFYIGFVAGALTIFALITRQRSIPRAIVIGRDVQVPRLAVPAVYRRRKEQP